MVTLKNHRTKIINSAQSLKKSSSLVFKINSLKKINKYYFFYFLYFYYFIFINIIIFLLY